MHRIITDHIASFIDVMEKSKACQRWHVTAIIIGIIERVIEHIEYLWFIKVLWRHRDIFEGKEREYG